MSSKRDYYDILGVSKSASESDIKQAYRKLAREHHPDVAKDGDKKKAEERFKEVNEAYQVLSDPQKRKMYDQFGHSAPGGFGNNGGGFGNASGGSWGPFSYTYTSGGNGFNDIDPFDVFEEFFGFRGFGGGRQPRRGKNLYYEMALTFSEAVKGIEKMVKIDSGNLTVKVPSGIRDGNEMRFAGKGMAGPNGVPPGDLFITFRVALPKQFERYDDDLVTAVEIDIVQAVLGGEVEIPVVSTTSESGVGSASLKIPSGTQSGTNFRLREKGMPRLSGKGQGDVIVQVYVKIPSKVSKKQRELLEEFKKLS